MKKNLCLLWSIFISLFVYSQDFTQGVFIVNEDWFGHDDGSVNFLDTSSRTLSYNVYKTINNSTLGTTTQYGTIYGDNFYLISKQAGMGSNSGERLVVADAKTLKKKAGFNDIGGDGRSFIGVNQNVGYIGTSKGIYLFDIKNLSTGSLIDGTEGSQIGNMIRTSQYVFAVKQSTGILIIDPSNHTIIKTISGSYSSITQSKDGNVWIGAGTKLIKLNPVTFETEEIALTTTSSIDGSWGAWNAGSFCSSIKENALYWKKGNKIIKYNIDSKELKEDFATLPGQDTTYKQQFYGAGLRIEPITDNLIITTTESGWGAHYEQNWIHIISNTGVLLDTYKLNNYYWFPALPVFPDNHAPEIVKEFASSPINISSEYKIDLKDIATDSDNLNSAIVKSIREVSNDGIISAVVDKEDYLVINPLKTGTAILEISFNSNGKSVTQEITINVTSIMGIEDINTNNSLQLYPNPFTDYLFIESKQVNTLSIYTATGIKVHEQSLVIGKNQIHVNHLSPGIYLIKANNKTYKIIKK